MNIGFACADFHFQRQPQSKRDTFPQVRLFVRMEKKFVNVNSPRLYSFLSPAAGYFLQLFRSLLILLFVFSLQPNFFVLKNATAAKHLGFSYEHKITLGLFNLHIDI